MPYMYFNIFSRNTTSPKRKLNTVSCFRHIQGTVLHVVIHVKIGILSYFWFSLVSRFVYKAALVCLKFNYLFVRYGVHRAAPWEPSGLIQKLQIIKWADRLVPYKNVPNSYLNRPLYPKACRIILVDETL